MPSTSSASFDEEDLGFYGSQLEAEADEEESSVNDETEMEGTLGAGSSPNRYPDYMDDISGAEDSSKSDESEDIELAPELQAIKGIYNYLQCYRSLTLIKIPSWEYPL